MFPLSSVLFPGATVPLRVFEERYLALVGHLLGIEDPAARVFGSVAIREGYEVGDHGSQSLYRVGVLLQMVEAEQRDDGTWSILAVARERIVLDRLDTSGVFPRGEVTVRPDPEEDVPAEVLERVRATFTAYRAALADVATDPWEGSLPRDPAYLSWALAAGVPLPMSDRQSLLESPDTTARLRKITALLRAELRAMNVIPSLPATEVARTRWSPN